MIAATPQASAEVHSESSAALKHVQ